MANNYWNDKQQKLCEQLVTATTQQEYTKIYNELYTGLRLLVEYIMYRYYSIPISRKYEVRDDVMNLVYMKVIEYYNPERQKAFTFCGTVARNRLYELVVRNLGKSDIIYTDNDWMLCGQPIDYGENHVWDVEGALKRLQQLKAEIMVIINKREVNSLYHYKHSKYHTQIKILDSIIEYVKKFGFGNSNGLVEYIIINAKLNSPIIDKYLTEMFGYSARIKPDSYIYCDEKKGYNYSNDDYTPIEDGLSLRDKRKKRINYDF